MNDRFKTIINSKRPVLVDFYADWCDPCKAMAPIVSKLKKEIRELRVVKVNVDHNPVIAHTFGVKSLPTLMVFIDGKPCWTGTGFHSDKQLREALTSVSPVDPDHLHKPLSS